MLPDLDVLSVMLVTVLGASLVDARSGAEVDLHSHANVVCEATKCPAHCPKGLAGYHYYYERLESTTTCLRCICGRPNGPADCGEDIDPTLCDSLNIDISEECGRNSTLRQSCLFSCSVSGQLWWAASKGKLEEVNSAIAAGANPTCQKAFPVNSYYSYNMTALHLAARFNHPKLVVILLNNAVDINLQTTDGATPTYDASLNGSIDALQVLIEHNADVNLADKEGETPLIRAAKRGQLSAAKALINANASLDVTGGPDNATALFYATYNTPNIALLLIEHNADVNLAAASGLTPLMLAAQRGHLSVAKALIKANASLNVTGGWRNTTALYWAAYYNNPDIALLLIEHNADVNLAAASGLTPLIQAAQSGHLNVAKALINGNASLDVTRGSRNATALYYAVRNNNPDISLLLIQHNANVNIADKEAETPLMRAALEGQLSVAKALINANASLDVTGGRDNATALYWAAYYNNPDIALLLIEHNADVNLAAASGFTPLMRAALEGQLSVAKAIINANASLDVTGGPDNATALFYAAYNNPNIAFILIEHNADVNLAAASGFTPLMLAAQRGHLSVAEALIKANASLNVTGGSLNATALHYAASYNNPDIELFLIDHNANVNIADKEGKTPLMWAAGRGQLSVATALINANASLDVTGGPHNATALYYAALHDNPAIVLLLIEQNANVNITASNGDTPLIIAAQWGHLSVAKALIKANASLDVTGGPRNATALYYAARYDEQDVALLLLQSGADAMITDEDGRTPAETAKHYENYELEDLIDNFSTINTQGLGFTQGATELFSNNMQ